MRSRTAGCFRSPSLGILSPLPGSLRKEYGNCDYDVRHNLSAFGIYADSLPLQPSAAAADLGGWQISLDRFPAQRLAVQCTQCALHRQQPRHLPRQRPSICKSCSRRSSLSQECSLWRNPDWQPPMAQPGCICLGRRSQYRARVRAAIRPPIVSSATPAAIISADLISPTPRCI